MSDSVIEIIGGAENNGGLNDDNRSQADGDAELKVPNVDPDLSIHFMGGVAIAKVLAALGIWFIYFENGNSTTHVLEKSYYRAWFSGFLAVMLSWGPVMIFYFLQFTGIPEIRHGYMWTCMLSVDGPMLMYALPLIFTLIGYLSSSYEGLNVTSPIHFWMGWVLQIMIMVVSFTFQIAMLPSIRVWYEADGDYSFLVPDEDPNDDSPGTLGETVESEVINFGTDDWFGF